MPEDRIEQLIRLSKERSPIGRFLGVSLSFTDSRESVLDVEYNPNLDNVAGYVHGGVYATLLDMAGWFACAVAHDDNCWMATSHITVHFLEATKETPLRAIGRVIKKGKRQDVAEMNLYDGQGNLVGHATGTFVILGDVALPGESSTPLS